MNKNTYMTELLNRYNADPNDPGINPFEKMALDKVKESEGKILQWNGRIIELNKEVAETQALIIKERGKTEAIVDMLLTMSGNNG